MHDRMLKCAASAMSCTAVEIAEYNTLTFNCVLWLHCVPIACTTYIPSSLHWDPDGTFQSDLSQEIGDLQHTLNAEKSAHACPVNQSTYM